MGFPENHTLILKNCKQLKIIVDENVSTISHLFLGCGQNLSRNFLPHKLTISLHPLDSQKISNQWAPEIKSLFVSKQISKQKNFTDIVTYKQQSTRCERGSAEPRKMEDVISEPHDLKHHLLAWNEPIPIKHRSSVVVRITERDN